MASALAFDPTADRPGLTVEQQINRLQEFYAQVYEAEPERFERGQIVWCKNPGLEPLSAADQPLIFLGYLDDPILALDRAAFGDLTDDRATAVLDCSVGCITPAGNFAEVFMTSSHFTASAPRT